MFECVCGGRRGLEFEMCSADTETLVSPTGKSVSERHQKKKEKVEKHNKFYKQELNPQKSGIALHSNQLLSL